MPLYDLAELFSFVDEFVEAEGRSEAMPADLSAISFTLPRRLL
jgi:hypothetical protein